ncbi:MAG: MlaD family protein [Bacteroidales bacterium]
MKISRANLVKLGVIVIAGLLIFLVAIYYLGRQQNVFRSGITIHTEFRDVKGLQSGNNVRFLGTNAGYVSNIRLMSDTTVRVAMVIDHAITDFIREDSKVEIQNDGIMGSKIIVIHPGTTTSKTIRPNSVLPSVSTLSIEEIFSSLEETIAYTTQAAANLLLVSDEILQGKGILPKLMNDEQLVEKFNRISTNLVQVSTQTNDLMTKLNSSDNDVGKLLNEEHFTLRLEQIFNQMDTLVINLKNSSEQIHESSRAITQRQGMANKILYDTTFANEVDTSLVKINQAVDQIIETSEVLKRSWLFNLFSGKEKQ